MVAMPNCRRFLEKRWSNALRDLEAQSSWCSATTFNRPHLDGPAGWNWVRLFLGRRFSCLGSWCCCRCLGSFSHGRSFAVRRRPWQVRNWRESRGRGGAGSFRSGSRRGAGRHHHIVACQDCRAGRYPRGSWTAECPSTTGACCNGSALPRLCSTQPWRLVWCHDRRWRWRPQPSRLGQPVLALRLTSVQADHLQLGFGPYAGRDGCGRFARGHCFAGMGDNLLQRLLLAQTQMLAQLANSQPKSPLEAALGTDTAKGEGSLTGKGSVARDAYVRLKPSLGMEVLRDCLGEGFASAARVPGSFEFKSQRSALDTTGSTEQVWHALALSFTELGHLLWPSASWACEAGAWEAVPLRLLELQELFPLKRSSPFLNPANPFL